MRHIDVIESELRLIAAIQRTAVEVGMPMPTVTLAHGLLEELLDAPAAPGFAQFAAGRRQRPIEHLKTIATPGNKANIRA